MTTEITFTVGKNAKNNWEIYKNANPEDTIFHLDEASSPYVIVNVPFEDITKSIATEASVLCKSKSSSKNAGRVWVSYTSISNTVLGRQTGSYIILDQTKVKLKNI